MVKHRMANSTLPHVIFITDRKRAQGAESAISRLPPNSAVIIRDYDHSEREAYAKDFVQIAHRYDVRALVAGDARLAHKIGADGFHMPEYQLWQSMPSRHGFSLVTAACKSQKSMCRAAQMGVNMALYSPIFPTRSHQGAKTIGVHKLSRVIAHAPLAVAALGGINAKTIKKLDAINITAIAAIDGLT